MNEHAAQDDKQSAMEQLFERNLSSASSTPQYISHPGPMIGPTTVGASLSFQVDFDPFPPRPPPYTSPLQRLTIMTCFWMAMMLGYYGRLVLLICK